ncbi:MAG: LysM peptidoglycan-binding domain-containing protein [Anaerolineae bacterium]
MAFTASAQDGEVHIVLPGENLYRIAQDYGVTVDAIASANNIANTWRIDIGQRLVIPSLTPQATEVAPPQEEPEPAAEAPVVVEPVATVQPTPIPYEYYTVGYGQSLAQIAERFGMSLSDIARLNDITNPDLIYAGQKLIVTPSPAEAPAASPVPSPDLNSPLPPTNTVTHVVQAGETLASIADRYGISWLQIAQANSIYNADYVEAGAELLIPGGTILDNADYSFVSAPAAPPARLGVGKEIIVDLSDQRTYAYEDGKLVRNVLSSTGLPGTPTVRGAYKVQRKYVAQTMTGPGYYLPDVPYIMYFYAGYALHGTYWHNNFGQPMSHGCVNLPTSEAEWFYNWTEIGTPVYVES